MTAGPVRKVTFWEGGEGETVPLLGPQSRTEERDSRGRRRDQDQHGKGGDSQAATSDAIEELERLPLLLLRTIVFFTLAICLSAFLGVVKTAMYSKMPIEACMIPSAFVSVWLTVELVTAAVRLRRVMMGEERKRARWVRNINRRRRRQQSVSSMEAPRDDSAVSPGDSSSPSDSSTFSDQGSSSPTRTLERSRATRRSRGSLRGEIPPTAAAALAEAGRTVSVGSSEGEQEEGEGDEREVRASFLAAAQRALALGRGSSSGSPEKRPASEARDPQTMKDIAARAARVSFLLQTWFRLWLTMMFFAVTTSTLLFLLLVRFADLTSHHLSSAAIASPVLAALSLVAIHSWLIVDGSGGTGGGAATRSGGSRSALSLGRRPIVALALLCGTMLVLKLDCAEVMHQGDQISRLGALVYAVPWAVLLSPCWVIVVLVNTVYIRALLEDYTGQNLVTIVFGRADSAGRLMCCWADADEVCRCPGGGTGSVSARVAPSAPTAIRRRAELTPSQRAAASTLVGGLMLLGLSVGAIAFRCEQRYESSWAVPLTILTATAGCALVGTGLGRQAAAYNRRVRTEMPALAKPLPVLYSERLGGWVAGPADPATITVFLLGEVTLRQESFGEGRNVGATEERGGGPLFYF